MLYKTVFLFLAVPFLLKTLHNQRPRKRLIDRLISPSSFSYQKLSFCEIVACCRVYFLFYFLFLTLSEKLIESKVKKRKEEEN
jgi:hypothetical protein